MTTPIENCPVCQEKMFIRKLECPKCKTQIKSQFNLTKCDLDLPEELLKFIKIFIYTEGNIKQCEKLMNCSYPKIKNLLKKSKTALGIDDVTESSSESILELLDQGKIDVETALNQIKQRNQS